MNHLDQILKLLEVLPKLPYDAVEIVDGDVSVKVSRNAAPAPRAQAVPEEHAEPLPLAAIAATVHAEEDGMLAVASPIIGMFYSTPSPDDAPFVRVGDRVTAGQTLCIVEAMKLMNEIPSPAAGIVRRVMVQDGGEVEVGQTLFLLEVEV